MESQPLFQRTKRKLYISYDHYLDAAAYDAFLKLFSSLTELIRDNSIERELDSAEPETYVKQLVAEGFKNVACLVVLCGSRTHMDKFVDWEIKAALDLKLGVLGIILPDNPLLADGQPLLPDRMQKNFDGGFAVICRWEEIAQFKVDLTGRVAFAMDRPMDLIDNSLPLKN
jgi:MTH538 TIR-like domain (DUF1863)